MKFEGTWKMNGYKIPLALIILVITLVLGMSAWNFTELNAKVLAYETIQRAQGERISIAESNQRNMDNRLSRIEDKIDIIISGIRAR